MLINFLGTRGSIPSGGAEFTRYGGNTSCVAIGHDNERPSLILDAGSGLAAADWVMGDEPFRGTILLTHLHWDHVLGLPFFRQGDREGSSVSLLFPEQPDSDTVLDRFFSPPLFPVNIQELRGNWTTGAIESGEHDVEGFAVTLIEIPHKGGRTFGFRIADSTGSVAYMPDHSPTFYGPGPHGDGAHHPAALELARDVDLLIHDSQFTRDEFSSRSEWGHCVWTYPIGLAEAAGVERTALFHHDPFRTDAELDSMSEMLDSPAAFFAQERTTIQVGTSKG